MPELSDDDLLAELGVTVEPPKSGGRTHREQRIISGLEDIQRFYETHGCMPRHGEDRDIFERLYAVRLARLRELPEARALDKYGLLGDTPPVNLTTDDDLLAELQPESDITVLKNVRSFEQRQSEEEIAGRKPCPDFASFKPLFEKVENELKSGARQTRRFGKDASVEKGDFFILGGQLVYIAEVGQRTRTPNGEENGRMRVIYSNGTESDLLIRSLQRALYKDDAGRRLSNPTLGPLFGDEPEETDIESGTIYVLRSNSPHPYIKEHRDLIHKIGVTGNEIETRLANAPKDATYLLAEVEIVATYKLANIFHRLFAPAQLQITLEDRFGQPVKPREWFLVPLPVIDEAVQRIREGNVTDLIYDPTTAALRIPPTDHH